MKSDVDPNGARRERLSSLQLVLCATWLLGAVEGLMMTNLKIPTHVVQNQTVRMECEFDLDGEPLYSVKWYKDGNEFYRYVPNERPDIHVFSLPGVNVDKHSSSERSVVIHRVNLDSSGRYRCEVSGEAPAFNTISDHSDLVVVVLPKDGPIISGGKSKYQLGDLVRMNCTSAPSKPHATLTWYINNIEITDNKTIGPRSHRMDKNGLEIEKLGLKFEVKPSHFLHGDIHFKCIATIPLVYKRVEEHRVIGDSSFFKQPLESRETRAQSHVRNDYNAGTKASVSTAVTSFGILWILTVVLFTR
ncbi:uncharacterized protein LOC106636004 [Copidosoma floridanum]|uniref:uncharacterized protein LOC106636004 n=1 Tax=Copidosoma floridanum TaxID=29053 RepID=UPI0006C982E1|nr:uncharacterized protein LOC106636004 [Copidosoma floridanum]